MAVKYVSSAADGSGDGTTTATSGANGAWTFAQMLSATPAAGDEIRILADGTYSRSATGTIAYANGTAAANIVITGANASGTVDGTRPTIQASAGSITLLSVTGSHIRLEYLLLDGNSQTSTTGLVLGANYLRAIRCKAYRCTTRGLHVNSSASNSVLLRRCEAELCSGTGAIVLDSAAAIADFCEAYNNTTHGIAFSAAAKAVKCIASGNSGASSDGFNAGSVGYYAEGCVAYGNGRDGFNLDSNSGFGTYLANCLAYGNSGEGFGTDGIKSGAFLLNCAGGSNTSGNYNATNLPNVDNFQALTANPFTNAASGDFSLNNTAGGGAALRGAGFPGAMPRGTTTGYADIGALQHQDSGGGGSGGRGSIIGA